VVQTRTGFHSRIKGRSKALYSIAKRRGVQALIDMIEKGNVAGAVAATNHHLGAIEERLMIKAPPEKLAIDCRSLFAAAG
jgi:DNA-binding GntR family transcriptional regulator